ncbi:MAG: transcription-repair coupling factor [Anaerolineae bacterium]|nr:transcription-repair coupling factor [Anaerolineae bacterium]
MQLTGLLDTLRQTVEYQEVLRRLKNRQPVPDQSLLRAARPYVIAALAGDLARPVIVLTGRVDRAYNVVEQIPAWQPDLPLHRFAEPTAIFYERAPWTDNAIRSRIDTLAQLVPPIGPHQEPAAQPSIIVASAYALMQKTLPAREFRANSRTLKTGSRAAPEALLRNWLQIGYLPASIVVEPGTFSRRGGILDIFPIASERPIRIEFFDDEIDSLRTFDPATQRSLNNIETFIITPARETLPRFSPQVGEHLADWFSTLPTPADDATSARPDQDHLANGIAFPLLEFYLPYHYSYPASLLSYASTDTLIIVDDWASLKDTISELEEQALITQQDKITSGQIPPDYPLPYITWDELQDELSVHQVLHLGTNLAFDAPSGPIIGEKFSPGSRFGGQLRLVLDELSKLYHGIERVTVVTQQAQRIAELWGEQNHYVYPVSEISRLDAIGQLTFVEGTLGEGWVLDDGNTGLHLITDAEMFGWKRPEPRRRQQPRALPPESSFADLKTGDYVVHVEYGIGRFAGLQKRVIDDNEREYLLVEYAGTDTLYVPIHQADRLSRYVGADDRPPQLNRLGTQDWNRTKENTKRAVEEVARELLELYAARAEVQGYAFGPDTPWQKELEASFPYIETNDQLKALQEVKADMEHSQPMDRLVCGDVGYGKTEVALRSAFKAVMDGKQVAMLVPTTVLAQQHLTTFSRRLLAFPVKVEMLSRFRSAAEQRQILKEMQEGQIDIIIGTHRLLQADIHFKDLGLLIIDEEQRFGVTHKEQLKQLRTEVDVLTLTATPIPRTLYMGLTGIRDISMIQTPPEERLPIVTHVGISDDKLIRQAILRELDRGGQVYFVHNRVQTIHTVAARLRRLVPEASIVVGHGQMDENRLEDVMTSFARGDHDVLVSTSIIESGLDIPNANTLVVDRADWFGLAQLYQIRGRVGRGASQAYAFFFHSRTSRLTADARARLDTISEQTQLGAGMSIAMRDLEIRGAGDLLGTRQSGHIAAVGFHLYTQLLAQAVQYLRGEGEAPQLTITTPTVTIDLPLPAYIPTGYIPEPALRIQLYRRLAELDSLDAIDAMRAELIDRFGPLPRALEGLLFQLNIKLLAQSAKVSAVGTENDQISIRLPYLASIDRALLQRMIGSDVRVSRTAIWLPHDTVDENEWRDRLVSVLEMLQIQSPVAL